MISPQISSRRAVQIFFLCIVSFTGFKFYQFVSCLEQGIIPAFDRPAGVEAFLPISALISLKHWLLTGTINSIHPSGLILFLIICSTALFLKKGFCSWVCPIGLLSECLTILHTKIFKKKIKIHDTLDMVLRAFKYILAGFFIYQIFYRMPISSIEQFIQSPYNRFADIKMLHFFTQISKTASIVLIALVVLSFIFKNFWCRYLCPYGALLGLIGYASLGRISRNPSRCTGCGKCEKSCPGSIAIRKSRHINSPECSACLSCVETCPEEKAIKFSIVPLKKAIAAPALALIILLIFISGITIARSTDKWQNKISKREYLSYLSPAKTDFNAMSRMSPEKMQKMILMMKQYKEQQRLMQNSLNRNGG